MFFLWNIDVQNIRAKKNNDMVTNDKTCSNFKYAMLGGTRLTVRDSITNWRWYKTTNKKQSSSEGSGVLRCNNWWSEILPCAVAQKDTGTHITYWNKWCCFKNVQILDELFQLNQIIANMLHTCRVIMSRPKMRTDNGKAA